MLSWDVVISSPGTPVYPQPFPAYGKPSYRTPLLPQSRWRRARLFLIAVAVLVLCLVIAFPLVGAYVVRSMVLPRLGERLGCLITVGEVSVRPTRVILHRLHVKNSQNKKAVELLTLPHVEARFSFLSLLLFQVHLTEVLADQAIIQVVRGDSEEDNITAILQRLQKKGPRPEIAPARRSVEGPDHILLTGSVLDARGEVGSAHITTLSADLRPGDLSEITLKDVSADLVGGAVAQAKRVTVRFRTPAGHFVPTGLPAIEIEGGEVAPWKALALTGISGTIAADGDGERAALKLRGGYGGVDRNLWEASGWIRPGSALSRDPGSKPGERREAEADLKLRADRFRLSSLDPILKNTAIIDSDDAQIDASLDLRYAQHALDFNGSFHMSGLSLFTPKLAAEPVRGLGLEISARGRVDTKTRRFRLDRSVIRWRGAEAVLEAEAEAQPTRLQVIGAPQGGEPRDPKDGPGWRERWRHVTAHLQIPLLPCQAMLQSMPPEIIPKIHGFRLGGSFYTDVRVAVDFAQLLRLPPSPEPGTDDDEGGDLPDLSPPRTPSRGPAPAAMVPPAAPTESKHRHRRGKRHGVTLPPLRMPRGEVAALAPDTSVSPEGTLAPPPPTLDKNGVPQPVSLSGRVGIEGCKVLAAPEDEKVDRLLQPFTHQVEVEPGQFLSFLIGAENPDFVPYEDISPYLINSIMTTEDNGFMKHHGFIAPEFRSALQQNLERGYFRLGASSITMQMIKNVLLSREKTLSRKLQEMFLTWYIEQNLSKERILEIYFNAIEFGPYIYGIGKAARHYFGKTPKELTPREAAWFSSILPNPKRRYVHFCKGMPDAKWEAYLNRILRRVHERGRLTDDEFDASMEERFTFNREEAPAERECMALIRRMTTPTPIAAPN